MRQASSTRPLTTTMLVLITIGAVDNIRNFPTTALFGSKILAFYILASIFFLIPAAMVSAELAARFPEESGIYSWVKNAFGQRWGFIAVWLQWVENVPFYPAILTFVAATIGYAISPALASNKMFLLGFVLVVFWLLTWVNIMGIELSAWVSSVCAVLGLVIPMILILAIGGIWVFSGQHLAIDLSPAALVPQFNHLSLWVTMQGVLLSLCGIELATVHAKDTHNPRRTFPIALMISVVIIIAALVLGALSIAVIIPSNQLSLVSGVMESFNLFFTKFHMHWMLIVLAAMLAVGGLGGVNSWIIAPTRGLRVACSEGPFKGWISRKNKRNAPVSLLVMQAVLVSIMIVVFFLVPSINGSYWLLSVLAAQIYMMMYILMFIASITLRLRQGANHESYQLPFGCIGHLIIAGLGLFGATFAFLICFFPPSNVHIGSLDAYELTLVIGLFCLCALPVLFRQKKYR